MPNMFVWTMDDFGAASLGALINGTFVIGDAPDVARLSDDDPNFDDALADGGQTQDPGLNQFLTEDLVLDGVTVGTTGDSIYNAAEGQIVNNTTGEVGRILYITINGGTAAEFVGVATTIVINPGDSVTTSALEPQATEAYTDIIACFTPGARIRAEHGDIPVEALQVGDRVVTVDHGLQPIRWIGRRFISNGHLSEKPKLRPITIRTGALGDGLPLRDMTVSPQHKMLVASAALELNFGLSEALVPAGAMTNLESVNATLPESGVEYIHILFDTHEIIYCEGAMTESFHPYQVSKADPDKDAAVDELFEIFPDLMSDVASYGGTARPSLKMQEAKLLQKLTGIETLQ